MIQQQPKKQLVIKPKRFEAPHGGNKRSFDTAHTAYTSVTSSPGLKGTVAWDVLIDHSNVSRVESKDLNSIYFSCRTLDAFSVPVFRECAKNFQQLMRTPYVQYFNHGRRNIISEPQENKMQLQFLACTTEKYHSAYSPCELNEFNLALTQ